MIDTRKLLTSNLPGMPGEMNRHGPGPDGGIPKIRIPPFLMRKGVDTDTGENQVEERIALFYSRAGETDR